MDIINERTVGMPYAEYVERRKQANAELKKKKKGSLVFIAIEPGVLKGKSMVRPKPINQNCAPITPADLSGLQSCSSNNG